MALNPILKKLVIAHGIKQPDIKEIFALGGAKVSSSRVKAFMAGPTNKNFEALDEPTLGRFLDGLIAWLRGPKDDPYLLPRGIEAFILGLVESDNDDVLEEIECLVSDARDALRTGIPVTSQLPPPRPAAEAVQAAEGELDDEYAFDEALSDMEDLDGDDEDDEDDEDDGEV